jgi:hypothetical protein
MLSGSVQLLGLSALRCSTVGGALLQQCHLRLVDPLPSVCEIVLRVEVLAAIRAMEQGRKRLWHLFYSPPRQGVIARFPVSRGKPCNSAQVDYVMTHPQSSPYIAEKQRNQDWDKRATLLTPLEGLIGAVLL